MFNTGEKEWLKVLGSCTTQVKKDVKKDGYRYSNHVQHR